MELNSIVITSPPVHAATVMLLRDAPGGLEVLLLKRHSDSAVLGGAYVFPGGKLDKADSAPDLLARLNQSPTALHAALNEPDLEVNLGAALYVAAVREAFEESGVLFAIAPGTQPGDLQTALQGSASERASVDFNVFLSQHGLQLDTQSLRPWSRWVTPNMPSVTRKRFDTRFFVAMAPANQIATHDDIETTQSLWVQPREALGQCWRREIELAAPQIMSLAHLSRYATAAQALQAASEQAPPLICPEPHDIDGIRVICYPGDPMHSVPQRGLPGPTRLMFKDNRFEPIGGFETLFE
jgi:8-oxo-dGTP pyrophosphatase MutT (NUDIX family)